MQGPKEAQSILWYAQYLLLAFIPKRVILTLQGIYFELPET